MSFRIERGDSRTSRTSSSRCFVYVLPCRHADLLKIGFSRTPLQRFQTLHARYFDYFDVDRGVLIEAERVVDARRIERDFLNTFAAVGAQAPFAVPRSAAGHTEWVTGAHDAAVEKARRLCEEGGLRLHTPLRGWLRAEIEARLDLLFDWSRGMLEAVEYERFNPQQAHPHSGCAQALRDVLDACVAFDIRLEHAIPAEVLHWYQDSRGGWQGS